MKQVVKVSISGVSFSLESDAYTMLEKYLSELNEFYGKESDGAEIVSDIEERIAELLVEKGGKAGIVSAETIGQIISLLGHPSEMEQQEYEENGVDSKPVKKLYRDLNEKVLGGVCGGIAAYFGVDTVMVRLIYVLLFFVTPIIETFNIGSSIVINIGGGSYAFMSLLYLLLWIIVPAARTVEQRCAMRGRGTGIDDIQSDASREAGRNNYREERQRRENSMGRGNSLIGKFSALFLLFIGTVLLMCGFAGLISGMMLFVGYEIVEGMSILSIMDYVELGIKNPLWIKLLFVLVWSIPFLGMLYGGVLLCFRFKAPKWHPGLIMFLVWVASLLGMGALGVKAASPYLNDSVWSEDKPLSAKTDTLYVNLKPFPEIDKAVRLKNISINGQSADYLLKGKKNSFVSYPQVRIVKHAPQENGEPYHSFVECKYQTYNGFSFYDNESFSVDKVLSVTDSLVTISPIAYSKENKFKGENVIIWVHVPSDMTVVKRDERGKETIYDK